MYTKDFNFDLPEDLIAQMPSKARGGGKLLVLDKKTGAVTDKLFSDLPVLLQKLVPPNALMVFNNSKVRRARLYAASESGAETEFLLINPVRNTNGSVWQAMVKHAKRQKPGKTFIFTDGTCAKIIEPPVPLQNEFRCLQFEKPVTDDWLDKNGHIPLPPYIRRGDSIEDADRYQTVYAKTSGSIAAPTAGLHFTEEILDNIRASGIKTEYVTLHVGLGTFLPVRSETVEGHKMHLEHFFVPERTAAAVTEAKRSGNPVIAVGTTTIRALESAWDKKACALQSGGYDTDIFIYPPYDFQVADVLFTNFHTPESTLVMLVSAFAGKEHIFNAYSHAVRHRYRFFSYGDAMLII